jgi:hypothetical protein
MRRKEKMMKKLLIFMLVLGISSAASATTVGLHIDPLKPGGSDATELGPSGTAIVYVTVDTTGPGGVGDPLNMGNIDAVISIDGGGATGTIVDALKLADLPAGAVIWGAEVVEIVPGAFYTYAGGWQAGLSFNPVYGAGNQSVEIGAGHAGNQIYDTTYQPMDYQPADAAHGNFPWYRGAIGYVEIHCLGAGDITVSIANGVAFGGTAMDDGVTMPNFGGPITVHQVPEPMTVLLLGLGGLFLRRRK